MCELFQEAMDAAMRRLAERQQQQRADRRQNRKPLQQPFASAPPAPMPVAVQA